MMQDFFDSVDDLKVRQIVIKHEHHQQNQEGKSDLSGPLLKLGTHAAPLKGFEKEKNEVSPVKRRYR